MSSSKLKKGKKVVNQEELRRLMREKQRDSDRKKRVESPFAKYNSLGHLSCAICCVPVKSEILWQAHVLGKQHKEKVAELKEGKVPQVKPQAPPVSILKRKAPETDSATGKRPKDAGSSSSGLPPGFFEGSKKPSGLGILGGVYGDDDDEDESDDEDNNPSSAVGKQGDAESSGATPAADAAPSSGLPADFFDSGISLAPTVSHSGSISKPDEGANKVTERKENTSEALPEGFFDDPVKDAKVRNVDTPKDVMDKEWDEFQKEMRQVNTASDAIVAEDDEEGRLERQIDEIDEQIECFRRVEVLRDKQDVIREKMVQEKMEGSAEHSGDSDEEDEEELLHVLSRDWRAKGALA
ncbi:zinc finger protein 830 [Engraulis encrasicolus]|uniref:zinc finger protein 830 n=1 Tax=Engraulis encrasicolus TaxID=184585 RepID=UPI002FCEEF4B